MLGAPRQSAPGSPSDAFPVSTLPRQLHNSKLQVNFHFSNNKTDNSGFNTLLQKLPFLKTPNFAVTCLGKLSPCSVQAFAHNPTSQHFVNNLGNSPNEANLMRNHIAEYLERRCPPLRFSLSVLVVSLSFLGLTSWSILQVTI